MFWIDQSVVFHVSPPSNMPSTPDLQKNSIKLTSLKLALTQIPFNLIKTCQLGNPRPYDVDGKFLEPVRIRIRLSLERRIKNHHHIGSTILLVGL